MVFIYHIFNFSQISQRLTDVRVVDFSLIPIYFFIDIGDAYAKV